MTTKEIADAFTALCKAGKFEEAGAEFWADDVVSLEPMTGDMAIARGRAAVEAKGAWWYANHEIHKVEVEGPFPHGDQFAVIFAMEVTPKGGQRMAMREIGLYTLKDGKIVEERFFYGG
ncbi:ketosteroid isomerase-like protein [Humitalea rosea]|uniref:Ketosteroid isomerase-like protein n=1 Tax=Humitalea rosea TaxID=990373 RepID=A0A2W7KGX6_9PROT|nr:SnoaL-like domain-containing protein [Humitalea rosea]PZW47073.1 ketosteroid isomerase-like protein [Humitalea rosea]